MGIPGYSKWFQEQNKSSYVPLSSIRVDHLYIDCNSLIHNAMRRARDWDHFHKQLHIKLNHVLDATAPRKTVMVAVDGPAPLAKLLTQRARRKTKGKESSALKKKQSKKGKGKTSDMADEDADGVSVLTGNSITPGTCFMLDVSLSVLSWAASRVSSNKWSHLQIEVSDGTVKGEGEVKILGRIARPWYSLQETDTHVMVGDDADLVLMSLVAHQPQLYVINSQLNNGTMGPKMPIFSAAKLREAWQKTVVPPQFREGKVTDFIDGCKRDLVLLTVMAKGNDYLPGVKGLALSGKGGVWALYTRLIKTPAGGNIVRMSAAKGGRPMLCLNTLITVLEASLGQKPSGPPSSAGVSTAGEDDEEEDEEEGSEGVWEEEEEEEEEEEVERVPEGQANQRSKPSSPQDLYLQGLVWMMDMYLTGECPDYRYTYDLKAAPSSQKLLELCKQKVSQRHSPLLSYADYMPLPKGAENPLKPFATALALLPAKYSHLLPAPVRPLMQSPTSPIADLFHECQVCKSLRDASSTACRNVANARLKLEAAQHALNVALSESPIDRQHVEDLKINVGKAIEAVDAERAKNAQVTAEVKRHNAESHKYAPFPVQRLADAAAQIPASSFSPAEQPLTKFGRNYVIMRQQKGTNGPRFKVPVPPFALAAQQGGRPQYHTPMAPLTRLGIHEPTLCGAPWAAFAGLHTEARGSNTGTDSSAAAVQSLEVRLVPEQGAEQLQYVSCPGGPRAQEAAVRAAQAARVVQSGGQRVAWGAGVVSATATFPDGQTAQAEQTTEVLQSTGHKRGRPLSAFAAPQDEGGAPPERAARTSSPGRGGRGPGRGDGGWGLGGRSRGRGRDDGGRGNETRGDGGRGDGGRGQGGRGRGAGDGGRGRGRNGGRGGEPAPAYPGPGLAPAGYGGGGFAPFGAGGPTPPYGSGPQMQGYQGQGYMQGQRPTVQGQAQGRFSMRPVIMGDTLMGDAASPFGPAPPMPSSRLLSAAMQQASLSGRGGQQRPYRGV